MRYAPSNQCYSTASSMRLEQAVNKFYVNGDLHINNGIQHTIAAQRTGDIHVYSQSIENRIGQLNYVVNLDNRKVEFISPYIDTQSCRETEYKHHNRNNLLTGPAGSYDTKPAYQSSITAGLLRPRRPITQFIEDAKQIKDITLETFEKLTGQPFPDDIAVRVLGEEEMKKAHKANGGTWSPGIMGFAINNHPNPRMIFIRKNHLDALMLTVGHELGHVLSPTLGKAVDEEAKAFAFELAWAKTIVEHNIGGLAANFNPDFVPAENGLHDKAFAFVQSMVRKGKEAMQAFMELARGAVRVTAA